MSLESEPMRDLVRLLADREAELTRLSAALQRHLAEYTREVGRLSAMLEAELGVRRQIEESLRAVAIRDHLTGLYNRQEMDTLLREEIARFRRSGRSMTLVLIDVDRFQPINEAHGHKAGDELLRWLAQKLRENVRLLDRAVRVEGDTFAVISPETTESGAYQMAERIRQRVAEAPFPVPQLADKPIEVPVTISLGIAGVPTVATEPEPLIQAAQQALREAKSRGGNLTTINFGRA